MLVHLWPHTSMRVYAPSDFLSRLWERECKENSCITAWNEKDIYCPGPWSHVWLLCVRPSRKAQTIVLFVLFISMIVSDVRKSYKTFDLRRIVFGKKNSFFSCRGRFYVHWSRAEVAAPPVSLNEHRKLLKLFHDSNVKCRRNAQIIQIQRNRLPSW